MQAPWVHLEAWKIDDSYSGSLEELGQPLMDYVTSRQGAYRSYRNTDDNFLEYMSRSANYVQRELPTDVLRTQDDYASVLELATREWTGYGAPRNRNSAFLNWHFLASLAPNVPRSIKARAHSCLAKAWFDRVSKDSEGADIDCLYDAGRNANEAVSLGLISYEVLIVGSFARKYGPQTPRGNRFLGLDVDRFERLTELWKAVDMRVAEIKRMTVEWDTKASAAPLQYVCAAEDCGIKSTKRSGLRQCAGECPASFKPSYCSKECQKMDWKRHKSLCKADATESTIPTTEPLRIPRSGRTH